MLLRDYQSKGINQIQAAWMAGVNNVLYTLPTGGGKTVIFSEILRRQTAPCVAIAHRQELVGQISNALASVGVYHRVIAPNSVIRGIVTDHVRQHHNSFYKSDAPVSVAGIDTLISRKDNLRAWAESMRLWVMDEAHHVLPTNKWGSGVDMFKNARGLGVTATPLRCDGKGLDGIFSLLIAGPGMRELIGSNYLTDYRIFSPIVADLNLSEVKISSDGDYAKPGLKTAIRKSRIVGDVTLHYNKIIPGQQCVVFATDVETAQDAADQFNKTGVASVMICAETPERERRENLAKFHSRQIQVIVNVDLFGEGFDCPGIEAVIMARPTQSYGLYAQQFGRALRILKGKSVATIIDCVGNVISHGLPDAPKAWSLSGKTNSKQATTLIKRCPECSFIYPRMAKTCPYCGYSPPPQSRSSVEQVDGDLTELTPEVLEAMRTAIARVDRTPAEVREDLIRRHCPTAGVYANVARHSEHQKAQKELRLKIATWAALRRQQGQEDWKSYREFYLQYGVDVLSAQALPIKETIKLQEEITL